MKFLLILLCFLVIDANAAVTRGVNGLLYGNICQTPRGSTYVQWQLVGSRCYSPQLNSWGFILNG